MFTDLHDSNAKNKQ